MSKITYLYSCHIIQITVGLTTLMSVLKVLNVTQNMFVDEVWRFDAFVLPKCSLYDLLIDCAVLSFLVLI